MTLKSPSLNTSLNKYLRIYLVSVAIALASSDVVKFWGKIRLNFLNSCNRRKEKKIEILLSSLPASPNFLGTYHVGMACTSTSTCTYVDIDRYLHAASKIPHDGELLSNCRYMYRTQKICRFFSKKPSGSSAPEN
ncbi:hypothetical protein DFH27DRAFT_223279 [Peziza echinospora]|nr:hypothetical protein DFH27DRAFT_223279 [Peziza echinospora]